MNKWIAGIALVIVFLFFLLVSVKMHPVGYPTQKQMDQYYIGGSYQDCRGSNCSKVVFGAQKDIGINNVVTGVVFDYRGFDTLGEATVLFTAITSIFMVFWGRVK